MNHDLQADDVVTREGAGLAIVARAAATDQATQQTTFIASTDAPDRAMDVVRQDWRLAEFRANPVILDNHDPRRVVGRGIEATVPKTGEDAGALLIRVAWALDAPDVSIRTVGWQHLNGFRSAGSVGFRAEKVTRRDKLATDHPAYQAPRTISTAWGDYQAAGSYYERPTLLEFSSATIPMNPQALQRALAPDPESQLSERLGELEPADFARRLAVLEQTVPRAVGDDLAVALRNPEQRAEVVRLLLADLRTLPEFGALVRGLVEAVPTPNKPPPSLAASVLRHLRG